MSTIEQRRLALEELDVIELEISRRFKHNPLLWQSTNSHNILGGKKRPLKETLLQQHEIKLLINQYQKQCELLKDLGPIEEEKDTSLSQFDKLYQDLKDFHSRAPDRPIDDLASIYQMYSSGGHMNDEEVVDSKGKRRKLRKPILSAFAADLKIESIFTDEEHFGNYLDLIIYHQLWLNLGHDLKLSYSEYLDIFNKMPYPSDINLQIDKGSSKYIEYITSLAEYLTNFYIKIQPLGKPEVSISKIKKDFTEKFHKGLLSDEFVNNAKENNYEIRDDGVYCVICDKKFSKFTVFKGHLNGKKHLKNVKNDTKAKISPISPEDIERVVRAEYEVKEISALLARQISSTRTNVERKKLLTDHERSIELESIRKMEEDEMFESDNGKEDGDDEDEDGETTSYSNPLKLPLGADGKPIPYWLFKLNGLGLEFSCEVCGNFVFQGRKNYINHFGEAKHLNGLKCLGVDTTLVSTFKGISRIEDVLKLKEKLNIATKKQSNFIDSIEEVEDEEGNVMSKRDYEDLKKQGLI